MATPEIVTTWPMQISNAAIILATLSGPILAVQAQKWLERGRALTERRAAVFRTLMATRAAQLAPNHVEALNAIPVEFYGTQRHLKQINEKWKEFLDHHASDNLMNDVWLQRRLDLFIDLLHLISQSLGYHFTRSQLARDIYSPRAHGDIENDQTIIRQGIAKLFSGETALPMAVTEFPATADSETLANQAALSQLLTEWLNGQRTVKVQQCPIGDNNDSPSPE